MPQRFNTVPPTRETIRKVKKIIDTLKINSKDVGSSEIQIGLLSKKINDLTNHFNKNKNDKHSTRGLLKAVNLRKRLLEYLKRKNSEFFSVCSIYVI